jgi:lipopolysaccharide transport system permease protein
MTGLSRALWMYRGFVLGSVRREFLARYVNSLLGPGWALLNPLAMIAVYTIVFAHVMQSRLPDMPSTFGYSIYLCAGLLSWQLFSEIVTRGQSVFVEQANLIKKLNFPRICLPAIVVLSALVNFGIIFGLFTLFLIWTGSFPGWVFLGIVPVLAILVVFAAGLGVALGVLNVFFRDVSQFTPIFLQLWFWFTPIVYPENIIPEWGREWFAANPIAAPIRALHSILLRGESPDWLSLAPMTLATVLLCALALALYRARAPEMVDEL